MDITKNIENASAPLLKKFNILKYNNCYTEYNLTYLNKNGIDMPQYLICVITLANASLKLNKLIRHFETNHDQFKSKIRDFFKETTSTCI